MNSNVKSAFEPLDQKTKDLLAQALSPACFTLIVNPNNFHDVLTCKAGANRRSTSALVVPANPNHPCVKYYKDRKIHLRIKGATIQFVIKSSDPNEDYYPVGVAFKMLKGAEPELMKVPRGARAKIERRLTDLNFSQSKIGCDKHKLTFTDEFRDKGHDARYEFSVVIQRKCDGAIGIIDPDIIHEP
jgi:hypothetical protein